MFYGPLHSSTQKVTDRRIRFRLSALADMQPVSHSLEKSQQQFADDIQNLMTILEHSATGRGLLQHAIARHVSVGLDVVLDTDSYFYYTHLNHIDFGDQLPLPSKTEKGRGRFMASFIRGLRQAHQAATLERLDVATAPKDHLRHYRCALADVEAILHLVAFELRVAGQEFLWRYLLSSADGDLAVIFERVVIADPQTQFDGTALKAVFNQWFAERARVNAGDRLGLEALERHLLQRLEKITETPSYTRREVALPLGTLPSGKNYLAGCYFSSGWYDGLDDHANQQHLAALEAEFAAAVTPKAAE